MKIPFTKYQGTGNDFVLIDNRNPVYLTRRDTDIIQQLCDRKFGIGADGLILLQEKEGFDFEMVYFNADGKESTMCGNGGRCIAAFAKKIGVIQEAASFLAIDGPHQVKINADNWVQLHMKDVTDIEIGADYFIMDTGSPHYVVFVEDISDLNVFELGQSIRYSERFKKEGINVNFVEQQKDGIQVATYERGVEDETLSCGTGVTAASIAYAIRESQSKEIPVQTKGGQLSVRFEKKGKGFSNVWLCGPTQAVYEGTIEI